MHWAKDEVVGVLEKAPPLSGGILSPAKIFPRPPSCLPSSSSFTPLQVFHTPQWQLRRQRSCRSWTVSFTAFFSALIAALIKFLVDGQNGAQADVPAAGQADAGEAEDDSDDDQEEGEGAPDAGAAGGMCEFISHPTRLRPRFPTPHPRDFKMRLTIVSYDSCQKEEEAQVQEEEEGRR